MNRYTLIGKVAMATAVGDPPRIGEMLVLSTEAGQPPTRFRVIDVQRMMQKDQSTGWYDQTRVEVHIELADPPKP